MARTAKIPRRRERPIMKPIAQLISLLSAQHLTLSTAESCTGGQLAARITSVPGASTCYLGSVIAYANQLKMHALDVPRETIETHGAVSCQVARAMAVGGRSRMQTNLCVSITGIAGPSGGTPQKPVGLVFIGVAGDARTLAEECNFHGDREDIQRQAVDRAIELLLDFVDPRDT